MSVDGAFFPGKVIRKIRGCRRPVLFLWPRFKKIRGVRSAGNFGIFRPGGLFFRG